MRSTKWSLIPAVASGLCLAAGAVAVALAVTVPNPAAPQLPRVLIPASFTFGFGIVGFLVLTRRPGNRIGWVAIGLAISAAASSIMSDLSLTFGGRTSSLGLALDLLSGISWLVWVSVVCWFLLLFPNGHLPSRRWRAFAWFVAITPPLYLIAAVLAPQSVSGGARAPNPFVTIGGTLGEVLNVALDVVTVLLAPLVIGALAAAIVRFRHSRGSERQQLKWLAYWAVLAIGALPLGVLIPNSAATVAADLAIAGLPIAVAIAIFRYRLYDIDLLIKRTFVYGATSAAIAATFFLGIVALQAALRPLTAGSELAVAASTLVSFALFQPIRRRVQGAVDHRFDRARYDATRTVDAFADQLRDEVDLDALRAELLGAVSRTMSPAHASLWLRERPS